MVPVTVDTANVRIRSEDSVVLEEDVVVVVHTGFVSFGSGIDFLTWLLLWFNVDVVSDDSALDKMLLLLWLLLLFPPPL